MTVLDDNAPPAPFDIGSIETLDVAVLTIVHPETGAPTTWAMQIAGPGHPVTKALQAESGREQMKVAREQEQARVNGKKWKGTDEDPEENRQKVMRRVSRRIVGWSPVALNGGAFPYSAENAAAVMIDAKLGWIARQVLDFFDADAAFIARSAKT